MLQNNPLLAQGGAGGQNVAGYVGEITYFADNILRNNHVWADGTAIDATQWPELAEYAATAGWAQNASGQYLTPDLRGKFLLGASTTHTLGSTGGEETHKMTVSEMPAHSHRQQYSEKSTAGYYSTVKAAIGTNNILTMSNDYSETIGADVAHNNMPPYYTVAAQIRAKVDTVYASVSAITENTSADFGDDSILGAKSGKVLGLDRDALLRILTPQNAGAHNAVYRGKYLGDSYTSAQQAEVAAGTFDDLYIGDYWTIGGVNWRLAAFDYYLNCGDTPTTAHHIVIVPDSNLYNHVMNDTNTTEGGYYNSKMHTSGLDSAKATVAAAFGAAHILTHREFLTNAVASGKPSGASWYDCTVELMNEMMAYGSGIFQVVSDGTTIPYKYTVSKSQLPLFMFRHDLIGNRANWWLRDIITDASFAIVRANGLCDTNRDSGAYGVRPAFCIS